jgi:hypothetical protein
MWDNKRIRLQNGNRGRKTTSSRGDREIGMNRPMEGDNPTGMLRKDVTKERKHTHKDSAQTNGIATGGIVYRNE